MKAAQVLQLVELLEVEVQAVAGQAIAEVGAAALGGAKADRFGVAANLQLMNLMGAAA